MKYSLINGNSLEVLKTMEDNSIDSIVTDTPYELGFMGKSWDSTGIAFNVELWKEALRVLKPGGHMVAFSGSRTYHRMAVAIEDAGFEIRDQIMWIYSMGFPKSLDVAKAIDKKFGAEREIIGKQVIKGTACTMTGNNFNNSEIDYHNLSKEINITLPSTEEAKKWDGYGTALKPAHEPIVLARKPLSEKTVAENVLKWGTGAINIDECRVETTDDLSRINKTDNGIFGIGNNNNKAQQLKEQGIKYSGRWPANLIHDGSEEVETIFPYTKVAGGNKKSTGKGNSLFFKDGTSNNEDKIYKNEEVNASRYFYCAKASKKDRNNGLDNFEEKRPDDRTTTGMGIFKEIGVAKQSNFHPTVKPTDLMQYLIKLITPINGKVLDPFNGSGSTGKACAILKDRNYKYIGIDLSQEYLDISKARIDNELK